MTTVRLRQWMKPGPLFLLCWLAGYLIWAFLIPHEWDVAIRHFLLDNHLGLKFYHSLGNNLDLAVTLLATILIVGLALIVALAVRLASRSRRPDMRARRDLFR
jgi:ABC-type spermidine/putrescine transport system permease subunit II